MYKICFYVPENAVDLVKNALFEAGAGKIGHYDSCSWQILGEGQFRGLEESHPALGKRGIIEVVAEYRVELVCDEKTLKSAIIALKQSHPYETPAYDVIRLEDF